MIDRLRIQRSLSAAWLLVVFALCGPACADEASVHEWIAQLDSNQYQVREEATRQLLASGTAALDALTTAANGDRPEPADRAVWILQQLANTPNEEQQRAALEHLVQLKSRPQVVADARAVLAEIKNRIAVEAIQKLGGRVSDVILEARWPQELLQQVILDDNWRGGEADLKYLADVRDLATVVVIRTDISRAGLQQLQGVDTLRFLRLYGTRLDEADMVALQKTFPGVEIDFRRGALLGIRGDSLGAVRVTAVVPGSAAADADIRVGDLIRKFNGKEVTTFEALTDAIRPCQPGETATVEIERESHTLEVKVTFGRFENNVPM